MIPTTDGEVEPLVQDLLIDSRLEETLQLHAQLLDSCQMLTMVALAEAAQETIGYLTSHYGGEHGELDLEEYRRVLINASVGGALLGGTLSGVSTTISDYGRLKQMQRDYSASADDVEKNFWHGGDVYDQLKTLIESDEFQNVVKHGDSSTIVGEEYAQMVALSTAIRHLVRKKQSNAGLFQPTENSKNNLQYLIL